ncbi:hypothetical protein [Halomarina litorea]|uniref:hypothetical protein n=1 Tax=Halomarina litorea TaxID=2961595 RepID=UPI0020C5A41F|nr:hypothetical protein [Halomarina sp. BCD28]
MTATGRRIVLEPTATRTDRDGVSLVKSLVRGPDGPTFRLRLESSRPDPVAVRVQDRFPALVDPETVTLGGRTDGWTRYPGAYAEFLCWLEPGGTVTTGYTLTDGDVDTVRGFMHTPTLRVATAAALGAPGPDSSAPSPPENHRETRTRTRRTPPHPPR